MKNQHQLIKLKSKKYLFLTFTLFFASCSDGPPTDEQRGIYTAIATRRDIIAKYLQCYALTPEEKKLCIDQLNSKYPNYHSKESQEYLQSFQYEAERLGFKYFLNDQKLQCESIEEGPLFIKERQAYLVKCKSKKEYLMRFNYTTRIWSLITDQESIVKRGSHE